MFSIDHAFGDILILGGDNKGERLDDLRENSGTETKQTEQVPGKPSAWDRLQDGTEVLGYEARWVCKGTGSG